MRPYQKQTTPIEHRLQQHQTSVGDALKQALFPMASDGNAVTHVPKSTLSGEEHLGEGKAASRHELPQMVDV